MNGPTIIRKRPINMAKANVVGCTRAWLAVQPGEGAALLPLAELKRKGFRSNHAGPEVVSIRPNPNLLNGGPRGQNPGWTAPSTSSAAMAILTSYDWIFFARYSRRAPDHQARDENGEHPEHQHSIKSGADAGPMMISPSCMLNKGPNPPGQ